MKFLQLHNGSRFSKYVMPYLVVAIGIILILTIVSLIKVQNNLINNCKHNGNPLREAVVKVLENNEERLLREIVQTKEFELTELFPNGVPPKIQIAADKDLKAKEKEVNSIRELIILNEPIDCDAQF